MRVRTRRTLLFLPILILLPTFFPMDIAQEDPATLRISLPAGTVIGPDPDPWLNEGWLLNLTGTSWTFTVRVNETSNVHTSYETHLIVALNDFAYNNLFSLIINGTAIPKTAFQSGIPKPFDVGWSWPDDVYPAWFNDTYINLGTIQPFGCTEVNVYVNFSDPTGARMHFDACGKIVTGEPKNIGDITWSPNSEDATVVVAGAPSGIPPHAEFTYSPTYPIVCENVTFDASSSYDPDGTIVSYTWNFGDGNFTTVTNPIVDHRYATYGNYTVTLEVKDNDNLIGYAMATVNVRGHPIANFTYSPLTPYTGENVTFNATLSYDPDGYIVSYAWDFGDNTTSTGNITTHSYTDNGTYTVMLNVTDNDGLFNTTSADITVLNRPPVAIFDESAETVGIREVIYFNASDSYDPDGIIVSYFWDFDDGTNATSVTAEHAYTAVGNYTVILTLTDDDGATDTANSTKTVLEGALYPVANFTVSPAPPYYVPIELTFNGSEPISYDPDGYIVGWNWTIQDETMAVIANLTGPVVSYNFIAAGTYTINLTVTDDDGLTRSTSKVMSTGKSPVARFTYSPDKPFVGEVATFNASDSTPDGGVLTDPNSYFWTFGDGTNGTGMVVDHTYTDAGNFTVTLNVTDSEGLWNTTFKDIRVDRCDVAVISVSVVGPKGDAEVYPGWEMNITVVVRNEGTLNATFDVAVYYNQTPTLWVLIETKPVNSLAPGTEAMLTFIWNTIDVPPSVVNYAYTNYTIKAEASVVPNETETGDNTLIEGAVWMKLMGDINGDGIVDVSDAAIIGMGWGTGLGDPFYDTVGYKADLNCDGVIDISDGAIVGIHWGETIAAP